MDAPKTLINAFISSRLDYCNSLLVAVADCIIWKLGVYTPRRGWSPEPVNSTTLHWSFKNCTVSFQPSWLHLK